MTRKESEAARTLRLSREARKVTGGGSVKPLKVVLLASGVLVWALVVGTSVYVNSRSERHQATELVSKLDRSQRGGPTEAIANEVPQDPASAYVERIQAYWLPEAKRLPDLPPKNDEAFGKLLSQIDGLVINIEDGSRLSLTSEQKAVQSQLIAVLSAKQKTLLPAMRQRYAEALDAKLFRSDIRVSARGSALRLVGPMFVRNANVEDMQIGLAPVLNQLRFRRVEYLWSPRVGEGLVYDLEPPTDAVVAHWDGSNFRPPAGS